MTEGPQKKLGNIHNGTQQFTEKLTRLWVMYHI